MQTENDLFPKISDYVTHFAEQSDDLLASVQGEYRWTYKELADEVNKCACALIAQGLKPGDRVATLANPSFDFLVFFLAATSIGCIWVGLNPKYTYTEFKYVIEDARPSFLVYFRRLGDRDYSEDMQKVLDECSYVNTALTMQETGQQDSKYQDFLRLGQSVSQLTCGERCNQVAPDDPAIIVYTSGSAGKPKGALLSHYGLVFGASVQISHFNVATPSIICNMPINHVACIADICCTTLIKGGKIVFQNEFSSRNMLATIGAERIRIWAGVPTMFLLQLEQPDFDDYDLSSVELIIWGGATMPKEAIARLAKLERRMMTAYGMTETSAHTCYSDEDASLAELHTSIGKPDLNMPFRISDNMDEPVVQGQIGELQFKGRFLMLGYHNNLAATESVFTKDGWFKTGDIGFQSPDGNIQLQGRKSDMFKSGGYNVYPREVEAILEGHPDVEMACVVGIPDLLFQEVGVGFVATRETNLPTEAELKALCRQHLANYKVPKKIILLSNFPTLPIGKIDKQVLKDIALKSLKLALI